MRRVPVQGRGSAISPAQIAPQGLECRQGAERSGFGAHYAGAQTSSAEIVILRRLNFQHAQPTATRQCTRNQD